MAKENPFQRAISSRKQQQPEPVEELPVQPETPAVRSDVSERNASIEQLLEPKDVTTYEEAAPAKKRGRPATGKRSDANWIGRTFYIQKETDFDVEAELLDIKRQGIELDKSELVERLLTAWVKWRNGENSDIQMFGISPRRKFE